MARYDRIARLDAPARDHTFPGWLTLRDLEGREREPELGRRARLRFLALRPVRRLLLRGLDGPASESFDRQIEAVREELGQLPSRDPERQRLSEYLKEIGGRTPRGVARATLDVGAAAESDGHPFAAEEFYRTGLELAEAHGLAAERVLALRHLARRHRERREWDEAEALLREAAELAGAEKDAPAWAEAIDDLAIIRQRQGDLDGARQALERIAERGAQEHDDRLIARAAAGRCRLALADGNPERAVEDGWNAIRLMPPSSEERNTVLLDMGAALRGLGQHEAALSAYRIVARWAAWPEHRVEARVEQAVVAAQAGDADAVRSLRAELLDKADRTDPRMASLVDLGLGRATLLVGDVDDARDHLRRAIATARDADLDDTLGRAEDLLTALESGPDTVVAKVRPASDAVRAVATRVVELGEELVSAG